MKGHADAGCPSCHRRNAAKLKTSERTAGIHHFAFTLHNMYRHRGLTVTESREILRPRDWDGTVAGNDLFDQSAHRFDAERQGRDVKEQPILAFGGVARELIGLHCGADGYHAVRVNARQRRKAEIGFHLAAHTGHAGGTAHQHHAFNLVFFELRITQNIGNSFKCFIHERLCELIKDHTSERKGMSTRREFKFKNRLRRIRERFLRRLRAVKQLTAVFCGKFNAAELRHRPVNHRMIKIIAPQRRIATRAEHFENAARKLEERDVKGAAAQVIDQIDALCTVVEPIGQSRRRGFV